MSRFSWIRNLFVARKSSRKPIGRRLLVESLEDRVTPSAVGLSAPEVYTEDTALNLTDIVITATGNATATLTLSNPAAGSLNTGTSGTVTSTFNATTGVWTATGPVADVNTLLAGLTFTPAANFNANFTIATSETDSGGAFTGTKTMTGTAVNDAPTATGQSITANEDVAFTGTLAGNDGDPEVAQTLTFAVGTAPTNGTVTINATTGAFTYTPAANFQGTDTFTFTVNDGTLTSTPGTVSVTVLATNDAPVVTVPGAQSTAEDVGVTITGISVSDTDVGTGQIKVTLSVTSGTLNVGTAVAGGLTAAQITGNGTSSVVLQGPIAAVNATLAAGVTYKGNLNFNGDDTLTVLADDLGNTGAGGPQTATATVAIDVLSPAEQVDNIRDMIQSLADAGAFKNKGRLNSILVKLNHIEDALARGKGKVAYNVAGALQNHLRAFRNARILTAAQANPIITALAQLRTSLSTGGFAVSTTPTTPTTTTNGQAPSNGQHPGQGNGNGNGASNGKAKGKNK